MPPKKIKTKNKNEPEFFIFIIFSIIISLAAYFISIAIASGVAMFFNPYISQINENRYKNYANIEYTTDKADYVLGENVKLFLINNLKESIFLAPCQHFKHFEVQKIATAQDGSEKIEWQPLVLLLDSNCDNSNFVSENNSFNKINKIADKFVSSRNFGAGVFRGVSNVYLQCAYPDATSCKTGLTVYTNEFRINEGIAEVKY